MQKIVLRLCCIIAVPSNTGLLILKANPIMGLGDSCYLCCYIFQIFFLQGSLALQFAILQRPHKASDIRFKWDSHISTAAHLKDSSSQKALGMTGCYN